MAISEVYSGAPTLVINAETTLNTTTPETTDGVYQLFVDTVNITTGDTLEIRLKEKVTSSATQGVIFISVFVNGQGADSRVWVSPAITLMHGWDMTLKQVAGTGRVVPWSIRKVG